MLIRSSIGNKPRGSMMSEKKKEMYQCYMYLALPIIGFLVLHIYPILWSMRWSFYSYNMIPSETRFIGLDNFVRMFTEDFTYWKMWGNTVLFALLKIPLETVFTLLIALMLSSKHLKAKSMFRTIYFMPTIISSVVMGLVFSNLFAYFGIVNSLLVKLHILAEPIDWLSERWSAYTMLVFASIWTSFGVNVMYFMSAISNVSEDMYEAAKIDGAGVFATFFKITLPSIVPVFSVIMLLSILGTLSTNEQVIILTGGGPLQGTHTVMSYLTSKFMPGFTGGTPAIGYGSAMSLITTILFAFIGILYNKINSRK